MQSIRCTATYRIQLLIYKPTRTRFNNGTKRTSRWPYFHLLSLSCFQREGLFRKKSSLSNLKELNLPSAQSARLRFPQARGSLLWIETKSILVFVFLNTLIQLLLNYLKSFSSIEVYRVRLIFISFAFWDLTAFTAYNLLLFGLQSDCQFQEHG